MEGGSRDESSRWSRHEDGTIPVAPSLEPALAAVQTPREETLLGPRAVVISAVAIGLGIVGGVIAEILIGLIGLLTNLLFYLRYDTELVPPTTDVIGGWVVLVPVAGALVIGVMARFGSAQIRGHGIPEVMERVLHGESRISPRLMFLKPVSAAIAIGTGGPFGAEGPIIATGGAFGSFIGQALRITADERKTLLAAGAAAGMAATFGSPVAAVLLAVELLLFEYSARSIIPVALASASATAVRFLLIGSEPVFAVGDVAGPVGGALLGYIGLGALIGLASVWVSRAIFAIEDAFERLPIHWMWWPALGAVVVGVVGWIDPRTMGVGYTHIEAIVSGRLVGASLLLLVVLKFVSWSIYLGSGTSGGTLAPLFIIGGGLGALVGGAVDALAPGVGLDPGLAGLVGMAAMFAGASHALLASVVFAFETTRVASGLLPLLAGCSAAYLVALLLSRHSIMTWKLAQRGTAVRTEYAVDFFNTMRLGEVMTRDVVTLAADRTLGDVREWLGHGGGETTHHGFPVLTADGRLAGVVTRRDLFDADADPRLRVADILKRSAVVGFEDNTLREAADHMVREKVGRLAVVARTDRHRLVGLVTRSDLLAAHEHRLAEADVARRGLAWTFRSRGAPDAAAPKD
ncbi:MAG: chloride channel protein [Longimicrobiales bacterium]